MNNSSPVRRSRRAEIIGFLFLTLGLLIWLSLLSYSPSDSSLNTSTSFRPTNLIGPAGSYFADLAFQIFGAWSLFLPVLLIAQAWNQVRRYPINSPGSKHAGFALLLLSGCTAFELGPRWMLFGDVPSGGVVGIVIADALRSLLNVTGAAIVTGACVVVSIYLFSSFSLVNSLARLPDRFQNWRARRAEGREEESSSPRLRRSRTKRQAPEPESVSEQTYESEPAPQVVEYRAEEQPIKEEPENVEEASAPEDIPIRTLEDLPAPEQVESSPAIVPLPPEEDSTPPWEIKTPERPAPVPRSRQYRLPSTSLLNEPPARSAFDEQELKDIAARIKSKFEEFGVLGSVVQINPGPVVTTFEFKPDAGIKYSRITNLAEDLCLGLHAESILIERIPGKPTVGLEVPNTKRELISLRQILESEEFQKSQPRLTISLGKDISGRIKVAPLESMPHLLIAGSTGSGKSVMLNSLIMSVLYKSTPDEVRMILIDPKRLEMGLYEGIPHLLTPVITDPKKATNALRNAVLEMERRLRLLAAQGVRNIDQYNRKVRQLAEQPVSLFPQEEETAPEDLEPLPYVLVLIDELADLMMVEGHNVEQSITRLAQMARAVGMHLVVATQRPSVDVITGLIKANFPARISFRVATRVDSRTILDVMGSEHLLGKGDMLFLPPGSSRLVRVHGSLVTEAEINRVVDFWKEQAQPEYDQSFLVAPPSDDEESGESEENSGDRDPLYEDAVRVVLEMGKASTSTLQRRLRLGYGRAARILDVMQRDGIIGPPDGSKPREVLKRPDWLDEIHQR